MDDLIVDIGNSYTKLALFREGEVHRMERRSGIVGPDQVRTFLDATEVSRIGVASVGLSAADLVEELGRIAPSSHITSMSTLPIRTAYLSRETLGVDRIANAVAVHAMAAGRPALAIDTGTCLTYDFVDAEGVHHGGAISPGIRLRALSMHEHSARLPLVEPGPEPALIGRDTESSMASGIVNGVCAEIDGIVARYGNDHKDLYVVITGGDALSFQRVVKSAIFADPLLTLKGIHEILCYQ